MTAAGEAALNFGSQAIALPVAGWAGLGSAATRALGITDEDPADTVQAVSDALTYQPRGELGKGAAGIVAYPFEKLAEAGRFAGDATLDVTGSPTAAAVVDTAVNAAPMLLGKGKGAKGERAARGADASAGSAARGEGGFVPLSEVEHGNTDAGAQRLAGDDSPVHGTESEKLAPVRGRGDYGTPGMDGEFRDLPRGSGASTDAAALARATEHGGELRAGELSMGETTCW